MAGSVASVGNPNFILVHHGRLAINVPVRIFRGRSTRFREPEAGQFFETLCSRYPWLTPGAIEVIKREAKEAMRSLIELEEGELDKARRALEERRPTQAMRLVSAYLEKHPDDADALQLEGMVHFALGEKDEGYRSFAAANRAERPRRKTGKGR